MPATRQIIKIDEEKCTGCGACIPNCPEGALLVIDGKARLVSDLCCDGLGACIGTCPEGAISIEEREAEPYDERQVIENVVCHGTNTIRAHLAHLRDQGEDEYLRIALDYLEELGFDVPTLLPAQAGGGCPGAAVRQFEESQAPSPAGENPSRLRQWPVQLALVPVLAPYLDGADVVLTADCVPFACANYHEEFLKGRVVLVGCPKLDDVAAYRDKLAAIIRENSLHAIEIVHMEVPCCFGLVQALRGALDDAGKDVPVTVARIGIQGEIQERKPLQSDDA
jgi:NAD-dependent dihydropyrimidine dehydrogenase PreA subunit